MQILGGGQIRQGKLLDFAKPNSQVWKNIAMAKVVMKGQPSNFKVRDASTSEAAASPLSSVKVALTFLTVLPSQGIKAELVLQGDFMTLGGLIIIGAGVRGIRYMFRVRHLQPFILGTSLCYASPADESLVRGVAGRRLLHIHMIKSGEFLNVSQGPKVF